jgi:hypothetical protein
MSCPSCNGGFEPWIRSFGVGYLLCVSPAVLCGMAAVAQSNQVVFRVVARAAPEPLVVNFQMRPRAADLASPAVTLQNGAMQFCILRRIHPDWSHLRETTHDGLITSAINAPAARDLGT